MGTRHLIAVQKDGRYGIAQYGQWDGYPTGQGLTVLAFARTMDREAFGAKVAATRFVSDEEHTSLWTACGADPKTGMASLEAAERFRERHPQLSRDTGAKVLALVAEAEPGIGLTDSMNFAGDSLFCEWAYVLDLDAGTLEVFKGFNKQPLAPDERFANAPLGHAEYRQVRLVASWPLDELPDNDTFIEVLSEDEDE